MSCVAHHTLTPSIEVARLPRQVALFNNTSQRHLAERTNPAMDGEWPVLCGWVVGVTVESNSVGPCWILQHQEGIPTSGSSQWSVVWASGREPYNRGDGRWDATNPLFLAKLRFNISCRQVPTSYTHTKAFLDIQDATTSLHYIF